MPTYTLCLMKNTVLLQILSCASGFFLIGFETSSPFRLPLLFRCSSISFLVNNGKLLRDVHHGISFAVCALGFSVLSSMFDVCPPEPHFHVFARVPVTNAEMVYKRNLCTDKQTLRIKCEEAFMKCSNGV